MGSGIKLIAFGCPEPGRPRPRGANPEEGLPPHQPPGSGWPWTWLLCNQGDLTPPHFFSRTLCSISSTSSWLGPKTIEGRVTVRTKQYRGKSVKWTTSRCQPRLTASSQLLLPKIGQAQGPQVSHLYTYSRPTHLFQ